MLTVMVKLVVTVVYEASWYLMTSVCIPTVDESLEAKVRIWEPELVETVTQAGVAAFSNRLTVVQPQIEEMLDEPYYLFTESFKKGHVTVLELPSK